ncbi:MAG TPA: carbon-nitrogen hydrolase family protein [Desulfobacteraceae bacterium]|nr:MAG: carbon-nitrogen hydrolase family protein [Deltaproteobacteria bacterium]HDZ23002.1 carbon-nitrogen hydrolase family protein [Desulfobacteraceae bacterium]
MSRYLGIAGVQMEVTRGRDNSAAMMERLRTVGLAFPWVDMVIFSELCASGLDSRRAEEIPNPTLDRFCAWAAKEKKWLIPGSFNEKENGKVYNTAVVISPEGEVTAKYRKLFPWAPLEKSESGDSFCVFEVPGKGRFGLCICYDLWFPEVVRNLCWMGAEAVICPTGTYTSDRYQEKVLVQANAISNQVYVLSVNGAGGGGVGKSIFVNPEGRVLQESGETDTILTEVIDLDEVSRVREYGTLGLCQTWKDLRDFKGEFPMYTEEMGKGELFRSLGPLKLHKEIGKQRR